MERDRLIEGIREEYFKMYGFRPDKGYYNRVDDENLRDMLAMLRSMGVAEYELGILPKVECSCGAKHTSNPSWHMRFCAMDKK